MDLMKVGKLVAKKVEQMVDRMVSDWAATLVRSRADLKVLRMVVLKAECWVARKVC
jgi:hypothetical protein